MKFDVKSMLKDKNVLRVMVFLSAMNVLGYLLARDLDSVAFFGIVGFLTTYFSKNMIVVLLVAMISTNFLTVLRRGKNIVEGMKSKEDSDKKDDGPEPADEEEEQEMSSGKPGKLDDAANVEAAYENLDANMSSGDVGSMEKHTAKLKAHQEALTRQMEAAGPMMQQAGAMMKQMGGVKGLTETLDRIEGMVDKIGGLMPAANLLGGGDEKKKEQK